MVAAKLVIILTANTQEACKILGERLFIPVSKIELDESER